MRNIKYVTMIVLIIFILLGGYAMIIGNTNESSPVPSAQIEDHDKLDGVFSKIDNISSYHELVTKEIDIDLFIQRFDPHPYRFLEDKICLITQVEEEFGIECLRKTSEGILYSVHKVKQGGLLYVFYITREFDSTGRYTEINNWYYVKESLSYNNFSSIKEGTNIDNVIAIDTATHVFIDRLQAYDGDILGLKSFHYLNDGIMVIFYRYKDGKLEVSEHVFASNFQIATYSRSKEEVYRARILPIDIFKY